MRKNSALVDFSLAERDKDFLNVHGVNILNVCDVSEKKITNVYSRKIYIT